MLLSVFEGDLWMVDGSVVEMAEFNLHSCTWIYQCFTHTVTE